MCSTGRGSTIPERSVTPTVRLIGRPTALIRYGGHHLLIDPTFDPPEKHPRAGNDIVLFRIAARTQCIRLH